ncbi:MAG: hypothetical protein ABJB05_01285 [Parafilimonas sp.]
MKLFIEKETLAEDVKRIFTTCYPFLKIELYKKQFADNNATVKKEPVTSLNKLIYTKDKTVIDISYNVTVAELENQFAVIGLVAEVFRKSGNVWVETSLTDNWTLQQQDEEAKEISKHFTEKNIALPNVY